jgi:SAM-dependent methyltransferase
MTEFADFVLELLPAPPARVLELGCGREGGVTPQLAAAGYDALGIDPHAPEGPLFRRVTLEMLDDPGHFDAVVASRVLHHVHPLGAGLDKLARLAPLLVVDEFAPERLNGPAQDWYERQHRSLVASGQVPDGPADLDRWRAEHPDVTPSDVLLRELRARYDERSFERRAYLYRWLGGPATEPLEETLIGAGMIDAVGLRWVGASTMKTWPPGSPG